MQRLRFRLCLSCIHLRLRLRLRMRLCRIHLRPKPRQVRLHLCGLDLGLDLRRLHPCRLGLGASELRLPQGDEQKLLCLGSLLSRSRCRALRRAHLRLGLGRLLLGRCRRLRRLPHRAPLHRQLRLQRLHPLRLRPLSCGQGLLCRGEQLGCPLALLSQQAVLLRQVEHAVELRRLVSQLETQRTQLASMQFARLLQAASPPLFGQRVSIALFRLQLLL